MCARNRFLAYFNVFEVFRFLFVSKDMLYDLLRWVRFEGPRFLGFVLA